MRPITRTSCWPTASASPTPPAASPAAAGKLRRTDFADAGERLSRVCAAPGTFAFVGKQAYAGAFGERVDHGLQARQLQGRPLFVLPSTSPANAAVLYPDKLHWFVALRELLEGLPVSPPAASGR